MSQQLATFKIGDHLFGIPVGAVQEVIRYQNSTPVPLAPASIGGLINLRGQVVTAIDLRFRLGLGHFGPDDRPMNVVVRSGEGAVSLLVDRIGDVVDTPDDIFEPPPETLSGPGRGLILGAYKLDGQLLLALDVDRAVDVSTAA